MTKLRKKILLSLGSTISLSTIFATVISCANNPNNDLIPKNGNYAYTIYLKDGTTKNVTYQEFMDYLKNHPGANTSDQVQYDNQIIKWLYKDEAQASVIAHLNDQSIPALTAYDKVFDNAKKKLNDAKKAIKDQYGVNWEPQWQKALLSSTYGGSFSEKQAIEYLAVQTMKSSALSRFTLKIDKSTYKASDIGNTRYPFLVGGSATDVDNGKNVNAIPDNDSKNAIALITSSYDNKYKSPDWLLHAYMKNYGVTYNIRHILYALKAGKTTQDPWTLSMDSIKKLYGNINNQSLTNKPLAWQNLYKLGSDTSTTTKEQWAAQPTAGSSAWQGSLVGQILPNYSDNAATGKTYGSLGMSSLYDDLKNLVPAFALPIAIQNSSTLSSDLIPKPVSLDFDKALEAAGDPTWTSSNTPSMDQNIQQDIKKILGDSNKLKNVLNNLEGQLATNGTRSLEYAITDPSQPTPSTAPTNSTHAVFSSDGLHMIYQEKITYNSSQKDGGLNTWMYNDLLTTRNDDSLVYNVTKAVNKEFSVTNNFNNIYSLVENEPAPYPGAKKLIDFVKTQTNYESKGNANFTQADIDNAHFLASMLSQTTKEASVLTLQKKYSDWWDKNVGINKGPNALINTGNIEWKDIDQMIEQYGLNNSSSTIKIDDGGYND